MTTVTTTVKGQVVIPAGLRKKLKIKKGTVLSVREEGGKIIMQPIAEDPVTSGRGLLCTRGRVLRRLLEDRKFGSAR